MYLKLASLKCRTIVLKTFERLITNTRVAVRSARISHGQWGPELANFYHCHSASTSSRVFPVSESVGVAGAPVRCVRRGWLWRRCREEAQNVFDRPDERSQCSHCDRVHFSQSLFARQRRPVTLIRVFPPSFRCFSINPSREPACVSAVCRRGDSRSIRVVANCVFICCFFFASNFSFDRSSLAGNRTSGHMGRETRGMNRAWAWCTLGVSFMGCLFAGNLGLTGVLQTLVQKWFNWFERGRRILNVFFFYNF